MRKGGRGRERGVRKGAGAGEGGREIERQRAKETVCQTHTYRMESRDIDTDIERASANLPSSEHAAPVEKAVYLSPTHLDAALGLGCTRS